MKKTVSFLLLFLLLTALAAPVSARGWSEHADDTGDALIQTHELVVDDDDLLTADEEEILRENARRISDAHDCEVIILTVFSFDGLDAESYADNYFYDHGYGVGSERSGILLLVSLESRDYWECTSGKAIDVFTDNGLLYLEHQFVSKLSSGSYYNAFLSYQNTCETMLAYYDGTLSDAERESLEHAYNQFAEEENPDGYREEYETRSRKPSGYVMITVIALIAGFVLSMFPMSVLKSKVQNVHRKTNAANYVRRDSMRLNVNRDIYLYANVTSRVIRSESRSSSFSGGGGGLGGGGSSTHSHSSGHSFGGHGGKF